jgi:hypothetical protein
MNQWIVLESTAQNIKLKDTNNGNGTFDYLYLWSRNYNLMWSGNGQILKQILLMGFGGA